MAKNNQTEDTSVLSFRVSSSYLKKIETFAKHRIDETGKKLSTSKAARMLLFQALEIIENSEHPKKRRK